MNGNRPIPMRILLHDYGNYPFTRQLAGKLAARGHRMDYVFSVSTQLIQRSEIAKHENNLTVTGIRLSRPFEKYNYLQRRKCEIEHGQKLAALIEQVQPDIVISANAPLDAQGFALTASHRTNASFIYWLQDAIGLATKQTLSGKIPVAGSLIGDCYIASERRMLKNSDRVILISDDFKPLMEHWHLNPTRYTVIHNWAPIDEIDVHTKQNAWAVAHNLNNDFCFLFTGILGLKHQPQLFVSLAEAFKDQKNVKIVIISEGEAANWLTRQQQEKGLTTLVILPSQLANVYPQVLGSADVLMSVLSNEAGGYSVPSKVLSYLCAERPLLLAVPENNLSARIVREHNAGLTCNPSDIAQWIDNAQKLYQNKVLARKMALNARKYAQENFQIDSITDQFEQLFDESCKCANNAERKTT